MKVRQYTQADLQQVIAIEKEKWGDEAATAEQINLRAKIFPIGSVVVIHEGRIVGYAAAQLVNGLSAKSWAEQTDDGNIVGTHMDNGTFAYGVGMSGIANGVGQAVIEYYNDIFIINGHCKHLALGSRLPGFKKWIGLNSGGIEQYLATNEKGCSIDPELKLYQRYGFNLCWPIEGYFPDELSLDFGAMIVR